MAVTSLPFVLQETQPAKAATFCTKVQISRIVWLPYSGYRNGQRRST
jgi:hypothetical protein